MFTVLPPSRVFRRHPAVGMSVAAHLCLLAWFVLHNPKPIDMSPEWLAFGDASHTYQIIYVPPAKDAASPEAAKLLFPRAPSKLHPHPKPQPQPKPAPQPEQTIADAEAGDRDSHAGSPLGRMIDGPITGHEVHVAYPTVFPNPPVDRTALPRDLVGDVVIEVTIDSQGDVVETKIVQAIGHGIDEKIEATLRRWHFQPATLDGTPVASRRTCHFHFPRKDIGSTGHRVIGSSENRWPSDGPTTRSPTFPICSPMLNFPSVGPGARKDAQDEDDQSEPQGSDQTSQEIRPRPGRHHRACRTLPNAVWRTHVSRVG